MVFLCKKLALASELSPTLNHGTKSVTVFVYHCYSLGQSLITAAHSAKPAKIYYAFKFQHNPVQPSPAAATA